MADQYIFLGSQDLRGKVYGGFKWTGGNWEIKQDGAASLFTGGYKDSVKGCSVKFQVMFDVEDDASNFLAYCAARSQDANINLFTRSQYWYHRVYAISITQEPISSSSPMDYIQWMFEVTCYLYSPYAISTTSKTYSGSNVGTTTAKRLAENLAGISNPGHIEMVPDELSLIFQGTSSASHPYGYVKTADQSLKICDWSLYNEIWKLKGNDGVLTEEYYDAITAITQFNLDTNRSGTITYSSGYIRFEDAAYAIYRLAGPNRTNKPVTLTATINISTGGLAQVEVAASANGPWTIVLDQDDFENSVESEHVLPGTEYMSDIYIRIRNASGTTGKYLWLGSIGFYAERFVDRDDIPSVPAGGSTPVYLALYGIGSTVYSAIFRPMRLFVN